MKKKDLVFPLAAAALYGSSNAIRKIGVDIVNSPTGGATMTTTVSLLFFAAVLPATGKRQKILVNKQSFLYFFIGGILGGVAQICILSAFKWEKVVIVSPLAMTTQSLFVLLLTFLF